MIILHSSKAILVLIRRPACTARRTIMQLTSPVGAVDGVRGRESQDENGLTYRAIAASETNAHKTQVRTTMVQRFRKNDFFETFHFYENI